MHCMSLFRGGDSVSLTQYPALFNGRVAVNKGCAWCVDVHKRCMEVGCIFIRQSPMTRPFGSRAGTSSAGLRSEMSYVE